MNVNESSQVTALREKQTKEGSKAKKQTKEMPIQDLIEGVSPTSCLTGGNPEDPGVTKGPGRRGLEENKNLINSMNPDKKGQTSKGGWVQQCAPAVPAT